MTQADAAVNDGHLSTPPRLLPGYGIANQISTGKVQHLTGMQRPSTSSVLWQAPLLHGGAPLVKAHQQRLAASVGSSCERCVELRAGLPQPPGLWGVAGVYLEDNLPVRKQQRTL